MRKFLIHEILPLVIILVITFVIAFFPYETSAHHNTLQDRQITTLNNLVSSNKKQLVTLCKFSSIMIEFAGTAADARLVTSESSFLPPNVQDINRHAAKVYKHVQAELKNIPNNCRR